MFCLRLTIVGTVIFRIFIEDNERKGNQKDNNLFHTKSFFGMIIIMFRLQFLA
jgi:hypothetical protein